MVEKIHVGRLAILPRINDRDWLGRFRGPLCIGRKRLEKGNGSGGTSTRLYQLPSAHILALLKNE